MWWEALRLTGIAAQAPCFNYGVKPHSIRLLLLQKRDIVIL